MMRKDTVTIESVESYPRTYSTTSRAVLKLAAQYGRCEFGETVTVYNMRGELVSCAMYTPEGRKYYRCEVCQ